jgi:hypothetical protein
MSLGPLFAVRPEIWQSAILSRFLRSPDRTRFDAEAALDWLDREGLLKRRSRSSWVRPTATCSRTYARLSQGFAIH